MDNQAQASIIDDLNRENAQLKDRIVELERYDMDGEIAGLKRDYKDVHRKIVQQTQELALAQDRNKYLEGALNNFADQLEADNGKD